MKKSHLLPPLLALVVFIGFYAYSRHDYALREQARQQQLVAAQAAHRQTEIDARRQAIDAALILQKQREQVRAAKEAADLARQETRATALSARDQAQSKTDTLARQIQSLQKTIADEQAALAKLQADHADVLAEQAFLKTLIPQVEANAKSLSATLDQIAARQAARAAAPQPNS